MQTIKKTFIIFALLCISAAAAYSQDCNSYLQRAETLYDQNKYCEAKKYYLLYSKCDADIDVSTEIATCEKRCKLNVMEGVETETADEPEEVEIFVETKDVSIPEEEVKPTSTNVSTITSTGKSTRSNTRKEETSRSDLRWFQLHAGAFFPLGTFADNSETKEPEDGYGHAGIGANFGFKIYIPIKVRGLTCFLSADAFYNGLQSKSEYRKALVEFPERSNLDYRLPFYLNVPITAGINYAYVFNNIFGIYGEAACGLNLSNYFGYKISGTYNGSDFYALDKWDLALGFTYGFEVGVLLFNRMTIGVRYQHLGSYKYKGKSKEVYERYGGEDWNIKFDEKLPVSGISLTLGILF